MRSVPTQHQRVLSGMRPTGQLHLGHFHGVLKNWVKLQHEYECYFFVADWHALTTSYEDPRVIGESVWEMVIDWLAVGINPGAATLFILQRLTNEYTEYWPTVLGVILLVILLFLPEGLAGLAGRIRARLAPGR